MNYIDEVTVQISPDPVDESRQRICKLFRLEFNKNLDMNLEVEIHEVDSDGISLFDIASTKVGLTAEQREAAMKKYFPTRSPVYSTLGSRVNSQTGQVDDNGDIPEKQALFSVTFSQLKSLTGTNDNASVLETIMKFVGMKMQEINARGRN